MSEKEGRVEDEGREREGGKVEAGQSCRLAEPGKPEENVCHHLGNQNWRGGGERGQEVEGGCLWLVPLCICLLARTYL